MSGAARVVYDVPDISCSHCKMAIEGAVAGVAGVDSVVVDVTTKRVEVVFDGDRVDAERIAAAIAEEGYAVAGVHAIEG
jgi:copper chaperone